MSTLLHLVSPTQARSGASWNASADPVPLGERLVGLTVVAVLLLVLFA